MLSVSVNGPADAIPPPLVAELSVTTLLSRFRLELNSERTPPPSVPVGWPLVTVSCSSETCPLSACSARTGAMIALGLIVVEPAPCPSIVSEPLTSRSPCALSSGVPSSGKPAPSA